MTDSVIYDGSLLVAPVRSKEVPRRNGQFWDFDWNGTT